MPDKLNGQWIGTYAGTDNGAIHLNIDENESNYGGVAYLFPENPQLPTVVVYFSTSNKDREFSFRTAMIQVIDRESLNAVSWESVAAKYPEGTTCNLCLRAGPGKEWCARGDSNSRPFGS